MDYEPTIARRRIIIENKIRALHEQRYSLELDARVNTRLADAETVKTIKKDMARIEQALDLYMADLAELPEAEAVSPNGYADMSEVGGRG